MLRDLRYIDTVIFEPRVDDPLPKEGKLYYNTVSNGFKVFDGVEWDTLDSAQARTFKAHITSVVDPSVTATWVDFTGFTKVDDETTGGVMELDADTKTFKILKTGYYAFGGCVHVQNNTGGGFSDVTTLTRLYKNDTTEIRCSQNGYVEDFKDGGERTLNYAGTEYYVAGDTTTLQYYINTAEIEFHSSSEFDNQIAASIWFNYIGIQNIK